MTHENFDRSWLRHALNLILYLNNFFLYKRVNSLADTMLDLKINDIFFSANGCKITEQES